MSIILGVYAVYYSINIVYDLFFRKEKDSKEDENFDEFSLADFADQDKVKIKEIAIDDVEDLSNPIDKDKYIQEDYFNNEIDPNIAELQRKYEEEQELHFLDKRIEKSENNIKEKIRIVREENEKRFKKIMQMAESSIQVIKTIEGQKIYQSVM